MVIDWLIDLPHGAANKGTATATPKKPSVSKDTVNQVVKRQQDILIVIDPGHGGEDPGSIGPSSQV